MGVGNSFSERLCSAWAEAATAFQAVSQELEPCLRHLLAMKPQLKHYSLSFTHKRGTINSAVPYISCVDSQMTIVRESERSNGKRAQKGQGRNSYTQLGAA